MVSKIDPPYKDTRSEATRTQHKLFGEVGTLCRTRANLINIAKDADRGYKTTLHKAIEVIDELIAAKKTAMKNIPKPQSKPNSAKPKKEPHWTDTVGRF